MKPFHLFLALSFLSCLLLHGCKSSDNSPEGIFYPDIDLPGLFHEVQMQGIFPDSKTFADAQPLRSAHLIVADYEKEKVLADFDLKTFVEKNFRIPGAFIESLEVDNQGDIRNHLVNLWPHLTRPADDASMYHSLLPLPKSYVVPGGRFREIYYWDSYFTMLGLYQSGKSELAISMLDNFAYLIDTYGFIPNGNRSYYLTRSQPPFFAAMVSLYASHTSWEEARKYLSALEKEYDFWMEGKEGISAGGVHRRVVSFGNGKYLNRYWDDSITPRPESYKEDVELAEHLDEAAQKQLYRNIKAACESGWDFSSRWFTDPMDMATIITTEILPIDLNSLMYHMEKTLSALYANTGNTEKASQYESLAEQRKNLILELFWLADRQYFFDYRFSTQEHTEVWSIAGMYPFYFGIALPEMGASLAEVTKNYFLKDGGLISTTNFSGQQWDAPNGWAPLQWIGYSSLKKYEQESLALELAQRWTNLGLKTFRNTGKMMEKYDVSDLSTEAGGGEYPNQDGFGWTNGVYLKMMDELGGQ